MLILSDSQVDQREDTCAISDEDIERRVRQLKILELFGTIDFDPEYDYKEQRKRP